MKPILAGLVVLGLAAWASQALAQKHVGANAEGGLHWSVAAPQGAQWSLDCRFRPVTYEASRYDRQHWANRIRTSGAGASRGRLPDQDGQCTVTKTGGNGPVAIAMVRGAEVRAEATNDPAHPAAVGFL